MPQITPNTAFGAALASLAENPLYKVFVETGTFDGEGSTKCLVDVLEKRDDLSGGGLFSFEANKTLWMVATRYWKDKNPPLRIIWARLTERMMSEEKIREHPLFSAVEDHFNLYYKRELDDFLAAPLVRMRRCDVAVLDSGEFCGEGELEAILTAKPKVIALDDIRVMKHSGSVKRLEALGWKRVWETEERNGSAIYTAPEESVAPVEA